MASSPVAAPATRRSQRRRLVCWLTHQGRQVRPRLRVLQLLARLLPVRMCGRERAVLLRLAGAKVGPQTDVYGEIDLHGVAMACERLQLGRRVLISPHSSIDLTGEVIIEDNVCLGHHVVIITADHSIGSPWRRLGRPLPRSVRIERGAWVGARVTVLPGVTIGEGAIVSAGSTVYRDVPPHTVVSGSPARVVRSLLPEARNGATADGRPRIAGAAERDSLAKDG